MGTCFGLRLGLAATMKLDSYQISTLSNSINNASIEANLLLHPVKQTQRRRGKLRFVNREKNDKLSGKFRDGWTWRRKPRLHSAKPGTVLRPLELLKLCATQGAWRGAPVSSVNPISHAELSYDCFSLCQAAEIMNEQGIVPKLSGHV